MLQNILKYEKNIFNCHLHLLIYQSQMRIANTSLISLLCFVLGQIFVVTYMSGGELQKKKFSFVLDNNGKSLLK